MNRSRRFWVDRFRSVSTASPSSNRRSRPGPCARSRSRARNACLVSTCQRCANRVWMSSSRTGDRWSHLPELRRANVSASSQSSRRWLRRLNGGRLSIDIDGSIGISPVDAFAGFVDREETRVRTTLQQLDAGQNGGGTLASVGVYPTFVLSGLALCAVAALVSGRSRSGTANWRFPRPKLSGTVWWIGLALVINLAMAETFGFVTHRPQCSG